MSLCHDIACHIGVKGDTQQVQNGLQPCEVVELGVCCPVYITQLNVQFCCCKYSYKAATFVYFTNFDRTLPSNLSDSLCTYQASYIYTKLKINEP